MYIMVCMCVSDMWYVYAPKFLHHTISIKLGDYGVGLFISDKQCCEHLQPVI